MNGTEAIEIGRETIVVMLKIGAPVMLLALIVGLAIALFQALTSIQEMTLTFVPKIIVIFVGIMLMLPFMLSSLTTFSQGLFRSEEHTSELQSLMRISYAVFCLKKKKKKQKHYTMKTNKQKLI